jgi:dihydrofolate reductase
MSLFKKKTTTNIDPEQLELIEKAQKRVKQKKRLYYHFVVFLVGSVFLIIANKVLKYGEKYDWFVWVITAWAFLFAIHVFNVFVTHKFMGKDWEQKQRDKLIAKQQARITKLEEEISPTITPPVKKKQPTQLITLIAAAGENNELGKDNDLVWHLPNDFKRFKQLTTGHHIIMGRKTFESFPKPLPNRTHVIITRQKEYKPEGTIVVNSMAEALAAVAKDNQPFIIGGGEIYDMGINAAHKIELTRVHGTFDADTFFPEINESEWELIKSEHHPKDDKHIFSFTYLTYLRK